PRPLPGGGPEDRCYDLRESVPKAAASRSGRDDDNGRSRAMTPANTAGAEGFLRNDAEREAAALYAQLFEQSADATAQKLAHVAKYLRRQDLTRVLTHYEIFKRVLGVKGSIVECGVYRGSGLMTWANLSAVLEPTNLTRLVYGFDSFEGFPAVGEK